MQAYSRTNRVEKETKPFGIVICYRNLKKQTDDALTLFSKAQDNLNIPRYVDTFEPEEEIDLNEVAAEIRKLQSEITRLYRKVCFSAPAAGPHFWLHLCDFPAQRHGKSRPTVL